MLNKLLIECLETYNIITIVGIDLLILGDQALFYFASISPSLPLG